MAVTNNDLSIFTNKNENGIKLSDRLNTVLTNSKYFDVLVGYFRITGFYLLKEQTLSQTIALEEMQPSDDIYTYTFSVANNDGINRTETALKYTIAIRMTTNLPLTYALYMNDGTENLFDNIETKQDNDGTYFKTITSKETTFGFETDEINTYRLEVKFPMEYNSVEYQGIIEGIIITVKSKQVIEENN